MPAGCAWTPGPRIRASNSAVGQESAGRPYLICIAFTARAAQLPHHAVDLADIEARAHQQLLQLLQLVERQLRHRRGWLPHRRGAGDTGGEIAAVVE